jgi:hypothetical protein
MNLALLLLFLATPQLAMGNLLFTKALPTKMVTVALRVDFGPAERPSVEREVKIPEGANAKAPLKEVFPITEGEICCHPGEVKGIDGVMSDPLEKRWWRLKINGDSFRASPHRSRLKAGDQVEWVYFQDNR